MRMSASVLVKGSDLRFHRKKKFSSAEAFAAACDSVSVPTVYRAERGGPIMRIYLRRMASELGLPEETLIATGGARHTDGSSMTGDWIGLQTATDRLGQTYVLTEDAVLEQNGTKVSGQTCHMSSTGIRNDRFVGCTFKDNIFMGSIVSEDWPVPMECPVFVLSGRRSMDWLQGYMTWFDLDSDQAEMSKYFLIRKGTPDFDKDLADAHRSMETELKLLRLRKFCDGGYDFETANKLLDAL